MANNIMLGTFGMIHWISGEQLAKLILIVLVAIGVQMLMRATIGRIVHRVVRTHKHPSKAEAEKRERTLSEAFQTLTGIFIWLVAIVAMLATLKFNIVALLTGAGVVSVVIGLGAQSSIKDFLTGIYVIAENQYRVGDIITLHTAASGEISGVVEDVTMRITKLRDLDGILHTVPHGTTDVVSNRTFRYANVQIDVTVEYDSDVDKVEQVINEVGLKMAEEEKWQLDTIEPIQFLRVNAFEPSGLQIKMLGKVVPPQQWVIAGEFRRRLKKAFDKHHVVIAVQQVVVHKPQGK